MRKISILLIIILSGFKLLAQNNNAEPPVHYPVPSSVWQFAKFGEFGVNEYKGLANINIPLYNINVDGVSLPLSLSYFSGGIKVSEEASEVGLGWSFNVPTIIQSVKDKNDYSYMAKYAKLPPFQGNPYMLQQPVYPTESNPEYSTNVQQQQNLIGYQNIPFYYSSCGSIIIDNNGYYNVDGKYQKMVVENVYDTEPDIFTVDLNGVSIKFCRKQSEQSPMNGTFELLPLQIINGRTEYQVELIPKAAYQGSGYDLAIDGIKITDPSKNVYFFKTIDIASINSVHTSISYKLTQIITNRGKEINFNYINSSVAELAKFSYNYTRRLYATSIHNTSSFGSVYEGNDPQMHFDGFYSSYGQGNFMDNSTVQGGSNRANYTPELKYNFNRLTSITTPKEEVTFNHGDRLDFPNMKKLESVEVKNIFNQVVKHWDLTYDYYEAAGSPTTTGGTGNGNNDVSFDLSDGSGPSYTIPSNVNFSSNDRIKKRLKLLSVKEDDQNPYLFEYDDTQIPKKTSTAIDYWGFYNGHPNASFKPNLTQLGYPNFTENASNDFNADLTYCKAGILQRITYPTQGYTLFNYELNQFDNLLFNAGANTPVINTGAGLRVNEISNYNYDGTLITKKKYSYSGGVCVSKRILTFESSEKWAYCDSEDGSIEYTTQFVSSNINNYLNTSEDTEGDYIGYSKVTITEGDSNGNGKTEKVFSNNENHVVKLLGSSVNSGKYYSNRADLKNGSLLNEKIYDANNNLLVDKQYNYTNVGFDGYFYGLSIKGNGVRAFTNPFGVSSCDQVSVYPLRLLTFYPIYDKFSRLSNQTVTEKFNGNLKAVTTYYSYDYSNNLADVNVIEPGAIFQNRNMTNEHTGWYFDLPVVKTKKVNNIVTETQNFTYEEFHDYKRLKMIEVFPLGNTNLSNKKMYYDIYDSASNINQYHSENGMYTCVIWGYNKTLPIAKIENAKYANIQQYCAAIETASNTNDENGLLAALDTFRNTINTQFPESFVTTYTHIPLVGVSTITDAKGNKASYFYDNYGKLITVKQDGDTINEYEYNYKPQN